MEGINMNDKLESKLAEIDFSRFSKVKGSLLNRLLTQNMMSGLGGLSVSCMNDMELDMVVAAGTAMVKPPMKSQV